MYDLWVMLHLRHERLVKFIEQRSDHKTTPSPLISSISNENGPLLKAGQRKSKTKKRNLGHKLTHKVGN